MVVTKRVKAVNFFWLVVALLAVFCSGCAKEVSDNPKPEMSLEVFKSPTCGCCTEWVNHLEDAGFNTAVKDMASLEALKGEFSVPAALRSCHTGVSANGHFFEGHIPAKFVRQFLENPPEDALGLAVPGMPVGSPGMEVGDRFSPYEIILVKKDGTSTVYAEISTAAQQF